MDLGEAKEREELTKRELQKLKENSGKNVGFSGESFGPFSKLLIYKRPPFFQRVFSIGASIPFRVGCLFLHGTHQKIDKKVIFRQSNGGENIGIPWLNPYKSWPWKA